MKTALCRICLAFSVLLIVGGTIGCLRQPSVTVPAPDPAASQRVIIDTDMAGDDWMAILYLLQHPNVTVEAITVAGTGEAHCDPGTRHALDLVALAGESAIPVACGREQPLMGDHTFPESWRRSVDNLNGLEIPSSAEEVSDQSAVDLLTSKINGAPGALVLLTLGPLTNVAEAFQEDPSLAEKVKMIYVMGGAVDVPGNIDDTAIGNSTAEWNMYVDPQAAAIVVASGAPVTFVALDATNHVPVTAKFYDRLASDHTTPEATFVYDLLTQNRGFLNSGGYYFWDPLAAAVLTDEGLAKIETRSLEVVVGEGPESGRTKPVSGGSEVRVAVSADGAAFEGLFMAVLNIDS